jgi:hypothetical protein
MLCISLDTVVSSQEDAADLHNAGMSVAGGVSQEAVLDEDVRRAAVCPLIPMPVGAGNSELPGGLSLLHACVCSPARARKHAHTHARVCTHTHAHMCGRTTKWTCADMHVRALLYVDRDSTSWTPWRGRASVKSWSGTDECLAWPRPG